MVQENFCGSSWSGGKDSCFALLEAKRHGYKPKILLTVLNENGKISRSHGIAENILAAQANAAGLEIKLIESSWEDYEHKFTDALRILKDIHQIRSMIFGDIDLQPHRDWEEKVCISAGIFAVLPLWKQDRKQLVLKMLESGIETMIISCNEEMGNSYLGQILDFEMISRLEHAGIDVCGENGEFHTLVLNCPLFSKRINVEFESAVQHENYWFSNLKLQSS